MTRSCSLGGACFPKSARNSLLAGITLLLPVVGAGLPLEAIAQQVVSASPDITLGLAPNVIVADEDVAVDNQLGIVVLENLGTLPDASEVTALGLDVNGDRLIAFETTTALAGGVVARPGDVVRYDGSLYSIEFDARVAGLPSSVATDATSLSANGLLLSFDTTVDLGGGLVVADEDLVAWNGIAFALVMDGSAQGLDSSLDVDAAQDLGGGVFLMSFDTAGAIGGIDFADEDVMRFDGADWSLEFDASAANVEWAAADLDAVMVPEPAFSFLIYGGILWLVLFASSGGGELCRDES
jgi:hypothetical protein